MVVGVNLFFDCDCLGRWWKLSGTKVYWVSPDMWINFSEKEGNMNERGFFRERRKKK